MVAWVTFAREAFRVTKGSLATHRSSAGVTRGFCSDCGSSLTHERVDLPSEIDVTTASLDDAEQAPPADRAWDEERVASTNQLHGLPRFRRSHGSGEGSAPGVRKRRRK